MKMKLKLKTEQAAPYSAWCWYLVNTKGEIKAKGPYIHCIERKALAAGRKFLKDIKTAEVAGV